MNTTGVPRRSLSQRFAHGLVGLAAIVLALAVGVPVPAESQTTQSVAIYADINFWGSSHQFFGSVADLSVYGFNDRISSMRVPTGTIVAAYEHINFGGRCETFRADDLDLRNNTIGNDTISSLRLGQACPVLLWSEPNYVGNIVSVSGDIPDLGFRFSNDMASLKAQGTKVALYDLPNYGGMCENFTTDDPNLDDNPIRQRVSSLRLGVDCPPHGVLFADTNYGGDYLILLPNPEYYGISGPLRDQASSVYVTRGTYLETENGYAFRNDFGSWSIGLRCERFAANDPDLRDNIVGNDGIDTASLYIGSAPLVGITCVL